MSSPAAAATTTTSVRLAKRALRTEVRAILSAVPRSSVQSQSARVCAHVERLECWRKAKAVSLYLAMDDTGEAQTDELVQDAFANGKAVYVPYCDVSSPRAAAGARPAMKMLRMQTLEGVRTLERNKWGIREPRVEQVASLDDAEDERLPPLDLIIVPGLAFDMHGNRLGHGRGYYDSYLSAYEARATKLRHARPKTVALALDQQVLREGRTVPTDEHDRKPDLIVTAQGVLETSSSSWSE